MSDTVEDKNILVVDDDPSIHMLLHAAFRKRGLSVSAASRLDRAEEALRRNQFDLVIADIYLGGILASEGLELLSFVKRNWPRTLVMIITGLGNPEIQQEAIKRGADYYLEKPFDIVEIQKIVKNIGLGTSKSWNGTGGDNGKEDPAYRRLSDHSPDVPDGTVAV